MNIDTLNAHGGFGFNPEPRPSEGRRTITVAGARSLLPRPGPFEDPLGSRGLKCTPRPLPNPRRVVRRCRLSAFSLPGGRTRLAQTSQRACLRGDCPSSGRCGFRIGRAPSLVSVGGRSSLRQFFSNLISDLRSDETTR
ncbi:hypothetical protein RRG08_049562 [Elysia crispata]|uniref:Uncharacterized protein n=1 Tax=Elysia crispata TaxID=231223 RepID=A0AAE0Z4C9_9GAST|nr:hypothetical protein RRG08_049548 [Elysia crispata]KAK3762698.1 hypothetical protein RRG08_049562 [Elysia crispata]